MSQSIPTYSYVVASNPNPELSLDPVILFAGESQTKPGHTLGPKMLDYYLLHTVLTGKGTYTCAGQTYTLQEGDSFLIEPEQLVTYAADPFEPWHYRWIAFRGSNLTPIFQAIGLTPDHPIARKGSNHNRLTVLFGRVFTAFRQRTPFASLEASGSLQLILASYGKILSHTQQVEQTTPTPSTDIVRQALRYLSTQYAEEITIETMAEGLGYNRAYLSRIFKEQTGVTPVTFLLHLRLDHARRLLRERIQLTVEQIAFSVGFRDPLYFSKQFKRMYNQSPTEYRQQQVNPQV
ncbi:AraC family transcriptional regulator [Paenibacillus radicibacter]|uniref:AraC family transcriptional regulator n=1 Tax=Paenibacillus radicibacter TaxID=2972488 RepID=UPI00280AFCE0|nr:AraC family transcriptional regulator [Paenibacillus radicibacter]